MGIIVNCDDRVEATIGRCVRHKDNIGTEILLRKPDREIQQTTKVSFQYWYKKIIKETTESFHNIPSLIDNHESLFWFLVDVHNAFI